MNLYKINALNNNGAKYGALVQADKIEFSQYGSGCQFIRNDEVYAIVNNFISVFKVDETYFKMKYKVAFTDSNLSIEEFISQFNHSWEYAFGPITF